MWVPQKILKGDEAFAIVILNQPLNEENKSFVKRHWNSAVVRVAVDGGATHLRNLFDDNMLFPHMINGDFDSVSQETLKFFGQKGAQIISTPDQDETDFTKGLKLTLQYLRDHNLRVSSILIIARNGDRLDHIFGNLNTLYLASNWTNLPIYLLGDGSLTWLLTPGPHKIMVPDRMRDSNIGLIPLGKECTDVTTTGLKWNLTHDSMRFGNLISTSNTFGEGDEVTVTTNSELIWTMEIKIG